MAYQILPADASEESATPKCRNRNSGTRYLVGEDRRPVVVSEPRVIQALDLLIERGPRGISSLAYPGVRLAGYIFKLRQAGIAIETEHVWHGGDFPGTHGVYRLAEPAEREGA